MTEIVNAKGCLLGLACGDALGRPVEFQSAEEIASQHGEMTEMLGHGTHGQPPGTITDDTEMALCITLSGCRASTNEYRPNQTGSDA